MIARVLCPGPSLGQTASALREAPDGVIIAVNRGSTFMPCDWLVAGDRHAYTWRLPDGRWAIDPPRCGIVTFADTARWLRAHADPESSRFWGIDTHQWEDLPDPGCTKQWSMQVAMLWAHRLGASEIHIYGCDHRGDRDFDGTISGGRDADRWHRESTSLATTIPWLTARGVCIRLHLRGYGPHIEGLHP